MQIVNQLKLLRPVRRGLQKTKKVQRNALLEKIFCIGNIDMILQEAYYYKQPFAGDVSAGKNKGGFYS